MLKITWKLLQSWKTEECFPPSLKKCPYFTLSSYVHLKTNELSPNKMKHLVKLPPTVTSQLVSLSPGLPNSSILQVYRPLSWGSASRIVRQHSPSLLEIKNLEFKYFNSRNV